MTRIRSGNLLALWLVIVPALAISGWSLYGYLRGASAPVWLAVGASVPVDGLALYSAWHADQFVRAGRSARLARSVTYAMMTASGVINWMHATSAGWPIGIHLLISVPAVAAAGAFELHLLSTREDTRDRTESVRRTARPARVAPVIYARHPLAVWRARQAESLSALRAVMAAADHPVPEAEAVPTATRPEAAPEAARPTVDMTTRPSDDVSARGADVEGRSDRRPAEADAAPEAVPVAPTAAPVAMTAAVVAPTEGPAEVTEHAVILASLPSDAAKVRHAAAVLDTAEVAEVTAWLSRHGHAVKADAARSALRRRRPSAEVSNVRPLRAASGGPTA